MFKKLLVATLCTFLCASLSYAHIDLYQDDISKNKLAQNMQNLFRDYFSKELGKKVTLELLKSPLEEGKNKIVIQGGGCNEYKRFGVLGDFTFAFGQAKNKLKNPEEKDVFGVLTHRMHFAAEKEIKRLNCDGK